jgi:hypothetical protein
MTRRHFVRTVNDLRGVAAPALAALLVVTACVVVIISVIRQTPIDRVLAIVGALLTPALGLLVDPGRHGRATDVDPEELRP